MAYSKSTLAYSDCKSIMEQAIGSAKGLSAKFDTKQAAIRFKQRCHYYRVLNRRENQIIYSDPIHEMHGKSPFDTLFIRLDPKDPTIVQFEIITEVGIEVTPL